MFALVSYYHSSTLPGGGGGGGVHSWIEAVQLKGWWWRGDASRRMFVHVVGVW